MGHGRQRTSDVRAARRVSLAPLVRRYLDAARSRARFSLLRSVHRFSIFAEYVLDRRERHPVFVLSQPRTGSSLLMSYLRSIPDADFASEVLNPHKLFGLRVKLTSKRAVIRHLAHSMNHCRGRLCGGKIHLQHLAQRGMSLADVDRAFPTARYLVLYRRSLLEQFVSLKLSEATRSWKWRADYHPPPCLRLDPEELHAFCEENQRWYREVLDTPRIVSRALVIAYEDLAEDPQRLFDRKVFPFLSIASAPVFTRVHKQNVRPHEEIVENLEEIRRLVPRDVLEHTLAGRSVAG